MFRVLWFVLRRESEDMIFVVRNLKRIERSEYVNKYNCM